MAQSRIFDAARLVLQQPRCPKCGARMWLVRIEPDEPGHDRRTFACIDCDKEVTEIVKWK